MSKLSFEEIVTLLLKSDENKEVETIINHFFYPFGSHYFPITLEQVKILMQISFQLPTITDFIWRENLYDYVFDEDKYIVEFRENIKLLLLSGSSISYDSTYVEVNLKHDIIDFVSKYINSEKQEYRETAKYLVQILIDQFELLKYISYPNQDFMQKENWNYQAADYFMTSIQIGVNLYTKITNDSSYERNYSYYELVDGRLLFNQLKDVYLKLRKLCKDDY